MIQIRNRHINIGTNLEYHDNLTETLLDSIELGAYTFSFNLGNSRNFMRKRIEVEDLVMSMGLTNRFPTIIFSVVPSMYNLCGNRNFLAWNGNDEQDSKTIHIIKEIEYELCTLSKLGGSVITECGSYRDKNGGVDAVIKSINNICFKLGYKLVLINSLDQYYNIGITLKNLQTIYNSADKHSKPYINIGINITYLWNNGLYDISKEEGVQQLFDDCDSLFDDSSVCVFMISDSDTQFGSKEIEIVPIGTGHIFKDKIDILSKILHGCHKRNIALLTHTVWDMEFLRCLADEN